jgi:hypothetical protein
MTDIEGGHSPLGRTRDSVGGGCLELAAGGRAEAAEMVVENGYLI